MPQIKKDCEINLQHPSYIKLYDILKRYEEPHLRDIFLQQVAYNCAIRAVALDFDLNITDPREAGCLFASHQNLSEYGLETYSHYICVPDYDEAIAQFDIRFLNLFYPFFDSIKSNHNHEEAGVFERYPKVQKPLSIYQRKRLLEILTTFPHFDLALPLLERKELLPYELSEGAGHIPLNALFITRAFYYFDAINFYQYTQSMIERSLNFPDRENNASGHDNRYLKRYLKIITTYILQKQYLNLI